jgi:hypothetical protein
VSEPRSLDPSRLTTGDRVLLGAGGALFVDSLLAWQRTCVTVGGVDACQRANAWGGHGAVAGVLMSLAALAACLVVLASAGGISPAPLGIPAGALLSAVALTTGLTKLLLIAGHFPSYGAWIGLVLLGVVAGGGLRKVAEGRAAAAPG